MSNVSSWEIRKYPTEGFDKVIVRHWTQSYLN